MTERLEDDYTLTPCGPLGGKVGLAQGGEFLGEFTETEDALAEVVRHSNENQYWPNIWWVSDHGNEWMIDTAGNEIEDTSEEDEEDED